MQDHEAAADLIAVDLPVIVGPADGSPRHPLDDHSHGTVMLNMRRRKEARSLVAAGKYGTLIRRSISGMGEGLRVHRFPAARRARACARLRLDNGKL